MRRDAVDDIGGFATQTVTEDAHTALRLHRAGWNSAYLRLPLAAGLATERLAIHVGQRMRWARGMTQIFRVDNPMFGRGLTFGQRICYLNAMLHFFFGLPRFVFLTAPLCYLMFRLNIIAASGLMVIVYAAPHLIHSTVTNSRLQSRYRHSFWGEIYESVLALYILRPTLATLINPKRGKFNVTEKGGLLPRDYFDYKIVRPHLIIFGAAGRRVDHRGRALDSQRFRRQRSADAQRRLGGVQSADDRRRRSRSAAKRGSCAARCGWASKCRRRSICRAGSRW